MPVLLVHTNLKKTDFDYKSAALEFSKLAAKLSAKPEEFISVLINTEAILTFAGNFEPAALVEFSAASEFPNVDEVIQELTEAVYQHLKVPKTRFFIKLNNVHPSQVVYNGQTVEKFIAERGLKMKI